MNTRLAPRPAILGRSRLCSGECVRRVLVEWQRVEHGQRLLSLEDVGELDALELKIGLVAPVEDTLLVVVDVRIVRVVGLPLAVARVGPLLQAHRHRHRVEHMQCMLDGLLVGGGLRHRLLHEEDTKEALVRVPRARHRRRGPRERLLPQVVRHGRQLTREGRLVGEDAVALTKGS